LNLLLDAFYAQLDTRAITEMSGSLQIVSRIGNIQVRVLQDVVQEAADMEAIQNMRKQKANSIAKQKATSNFKRSKMRGPCKAFV